MNGGSSSLKVTVNGKKYLITGIKRETSCKGLLCAIAKVTSQEEASSLKQICSGVKGKSNNENLLEHFKGDRQLAGDLTSLNVFNSLGKDAKIIAKETVTVHKEIIIDDSTQVQHSSSKHKNSKKQKISKESKKEEKKEKKSKHKHRKNKELLTTTTLTTTTETKIKHKVKHRSVDDSDIETYKRDGLKRMKHHKRRVYDDSDIEVYRALQNIVVDQTKKLHRIQSHTREVKRTAWMKELTRNSQIYYIDDRPPVSKDVDAEPVETTETCVYDKDDGNDSGLPSPEYDSSESQEIQPIKIKEALLLNNNNNTKYQVTDNTIDESKQTSLTNQNNGQIKQLNGDISPNEISVKNTNNENSNSMAESISVLNENRLNSESLDKSGCSTNNNNVEENTEVETNRLPAYTERADQNKDTLQLLISKETESNRHEITAIDNNKFNLIQNKEEAYKSMMIDKNKNILNDSEACEREVNKMVAFNEALFKGSSSANAALGGGKKNDKKKLKKADISDPVLLSPNSMKKHQSVKKVHSVLGKQAADVLRKDVLKSHSLNGETKELTKEKEKFFNKKLKEIRSTKSKKSKSKDKNEPEYFSKSQFKDNAITTASKESLSTANTKLEISTNGSVNNITTETDVITEQNDKNNTNSKSHSVLLATNSGKDTRSDSGCKHTEMIEKTTDVQTALTADEILNDILEYERNLKNELDQIIKTSPEEKTEEVNNNNTTNEKKDTKIEKKDTKIENELTTKWQDKQNNVVETSTNLKVEQLNNKKHSNNIIPSVNGNSSSIVNSTTSTNGHQNISESEDSVDSTVCTTTNMRDNDDKERLKIIENYLQEKQALDEISEKLSDYNYALTRLQEEMELFDIEEKEQKSLSEIDEEERSTHEEINNIRSLLKSVADLTSYQRREMSENMELLDNIDLEFRTQKANYENLRNGTWKNNSKSAPRSLIKNAKVKRRNSLLSALDGQRQSNGKSSSFV